MATIQPTHTMPPLAAPTRPEVDAFVSICFGMGVPDWVSKHSAPAVDQRHSGTAANDTASGGVAASKTHALTSDGNLMVAGVERGCAAETSVPQVLMPCFQILLLFSDLDPHFMNLHRLLYDS